MRVLLCFAALLISIAAVSGETCRNTGNCQHVNCSAHHLLECHLFQCTCSDYSQPSCSQQGDCSGDCSRTWHCIDSHCRCGYGIPVNGGK